MENVAAVEEVRTQAVGSGGTIPDLVGVDASGKERVLIEVKFWADLQRSQPNGYLERMKRQLLDDGPALLLFLVPDERVRTLWPVLRRRLTDVAVDLDSERKCVRVGDGQRHLMVTGWTGLLDRMATRARDAGEDSVEASAC